MLFDTDVGGAGLPEIANSLRFDGTNAYLTRTPASEGNRKTWTWSGWVKRGRLGSVSPVISVSPTTNDKFVLRFTASNNLEVFSWRAGAYDWRKVTSASYADAAAWYHVVLVCDTTNATAEDRVRLYVNGIRVTVFSTNTNPSASYASGYLNSSLEHVLSADKNPAAYSDGYLSEINFIDGQALDPSYFGQVSAETGAWIPKKYTGAYGTNGFYLPFNDGSNLTNLTADRSGNGNNWTANNISLTAGSSYDWMDDTPSNNFAVLNPLSIFGTAGLPPTADGNLFFATQTPQGSIPATIFVTSGKWYAEFVATVANNATGFGVGSTQSKAAFFSDSSGGGFAYYADGRILGNAGLIASVATFTNGDVISVALDMDARSVAFYKNNTLIHTQTTGFVIEAYTFFIGDGSASAGINAVANFGQRPFSYTPPAGFKALCTANLPTPSILNPSDHFQIKLAAGASIKSTTDAVFSGQILEVIKDRANSNNWQWMDNARNLAGNVLQSNTTVAETGYVAPAGNSVGYAWKSGGWPVSNTAGTVTSKVSANVSAGFSIVTFKAPASGVFSVGHGLGVAPKMWILKSTTSGDGWYVGHASLPVPATDYLSLQSTSGKFSLANMWGASGPSSTLLSALVGGGAPASQSCVAYCFAEVPGFSKFGSYTGNGSADGPFVWCGFRPAFVMVKRSDSAGTWYLVDNKRNGTNSVQGLLYPNLSNAEATINWDILSNGFKMRDSGADLNASGGTYIFMAFAEAPFKFANAR